LSSAATEIERAANGWEPFGGDTTLIVMAVGPQSSPWEKGRNTRKQGEETNHNLVVDQFMSGSIIEYVCDYLSMCCAHLLVVRSYLPQFDPHTDTANPSPANQDRKEDLSPLAA
jgi:hypothetical protein